MKKNKEELQAYKEILKDINDLLEEPSMPEVVKESLNKVYEALKAQGENVEDMTESMKSHIEEQLKKIKEGNHEIAKEWSKKLERQEFPDTMTIKSEDLEAIKSGTAKSNKLLEAVYKFLGLIRAEGISAKLNRNKGAKDYIAVRLTDGQKFYKAIFGGGASGAGGGPSFKLDNGEYDNFHGDNNGNLKVINNPSDVDIKSAAISCNTSGDNEIVSAVAGKKIRVLSYALNVAGTVSVKWKKGSTDLSGAFSFQEREGLTINGGPYGLFETGTNQALNLNLSDAVYAYGHVTYIEV